MARHDHHIVPEDRWNPSANPTDTGQPQEKTVHEALPLDQPPVIGKTYLVPCVRTSWPMSDKAPGSDREARWIPIIGHPHRDDDAVDYPTLHWHADHRFVDFSQLRQSTIVDRHYRHFDNTPYDLTMAAFQAPIPGILPEPLPGEPERHHTLPQIAELQIEQSRYYRIMALECRQEIPAYAHENGSWLSELTEQFRNRTLIDGRYCPHRSQDLATVEPDHDGIVTCPLHGLRWCARTGAIMEPLPAIDEELAYHEMLAAEQNTG